MSFDDRTFGDIEIADALDTCMRAWREGWEVLPPKTVSAYADDKRKLPPGAASEPGQWRTSRTPFLREIQDCLSAHSPVRQCALRKSTQIGGSEVVFNLIACTIEEAPAAMLLVLPTIAFAHDWVDQRFNPAVELMPGLKRRLGSRRSRDSGNRTLSKRFPGGHFFITGANSSAGLAGKPIKILILDEVDKYPRNLDKQGSAKTQAIRRTSTHPERKIFILSSPSVKGASEIDDEFEAGDQRYYNVPCPLCYQKQVLEDSQITPDGKYLCIHCGKLIDEAYKEWMLQEVSDARPFGACWIPTKTDGDPTIRSYHIWAAYTPVGLGYSWKEIAAMRDAALKDPEKAIEYNNTILGTSHDSSTMRLDHEELRKRHGQWKTRTVPQGVLVVTVGVDVQINRFDVSFVGWGRGERAWILDWQSLPADPTVAADYDQLDELMTAPLVNDYGVQIRPSMMAIDSGKWTHDVYAYVRRSPQKVIAVKGYENKDRPIILRGTPVDLRLNGRVIPKGVKVWPLGTRQAKDTLVGRLAGDEQRAAEGRFFSFPEDLPDEYYEQLGVEKFNEQLDRWICPRGKRNEALDTLVYAYAAALHPSVHIHKHRDPEWGALEAHYEPASRDLFAASQRPAPRGAGATSSAPAASPSLPEGPATQTVAPALAPVSTPQKTAGPKVPRTRDIEPDSGRGWGI